MVGEHGDGDGGWCAEKDRSRDPPSLAFSLDSTTGSRPNKESQEK